MPLLLIPTVPSVPTALTIATPAPRTAHPTPTAHPIPTAHTTPQRPASHAGWLGGRLQVFRSPQLALIPTTPVLLTATSISAPAPI